MKKKVGFFKRLIRSNRFLMLFSVVLAFIAWVVIATAVEPNFDLEIKDVPVDMEFQSTVLNRLGLNVISIEPQTVSVRVYGKRYVVGQLGPEDIRIMPQITSVTTSGTQSLALSWVQEGGEEYTVQAITPPTASVRIDRVDSKVMGIEADVVGVGISSGYIKEDNIISPEQVTISGPLSDINKVAHAIVKVEVNKTLSATETATGKITLFDADGNEVTSPHLKLDYDTAEVTVPVLKVKEVPVQVRFLNIPPGFPMEELGYTLSNEAIRVAGPATLVDSYDAVMLDSVDFKRLGIGTKEVFDIELPSGFVNVDNILSVLVTFDTEDFVSQNFNISNIDILNPPANYEVRLINPSISGVRIIGPSETLETMTAEDLVAEIDLSDREVVTGQIKVPVRIYAPTKGTVWAEGDYVALVEVSE